MNIRKNKIVNFVMLILASFVYLGCNGAGNSALSDGSFGLKMTVIQGDNQVISPAKSPEIIPTIQVTAADGTPSVGLELKISTTSSYKANLLATTVVTDSNGMAVIPFTAPVYQAIDFQVTVSASQGSLSYTFSFSTPSTSPATRFVLATTKGSNIVAGELFGYIVTLVNEDGSLYKYTGEMKLFWQYTVTKSWTGVSPFQPTSSDFDCRFVKGICRTEEIYYLTDVREKQLVSTGDGDVSPPGVPNYVDAFAIEINVLPNLPYTYALADKSGGPVTGAVAYSPTKKIKVTADYPARDLYGAVIDKVGNYISEATDSINWNSSDLNLQSSLTVDSLIKNKVTFTPNKVASSYIYAKDDNQVLATSSIPVDVKPGFPAKIQVTTSRVGNVYLSGESILPTLKLVDSKENVCTQIIDNVELKVSSTKITDRFGPLTTSATVGGEVTLNSGIIGASGCLSILGKSGWCGEELTIYPFMSMGSLEQGVLNLKFKDVRFKPQVTFKSTKKNFTVAEDSDLYPGGVLQLAADSPVITSDPMEITLTSTGIPTQYVFLTDVPVGQDVDTWLSQYFYKTSGSLKNTANIFHSLSDSSTPVIDVPASASAFNVYAFYADSTGNIIFNLPGANSGKPNCDLSDPDNLTDPVLTPLCASVPLNFVADGSVLNSTSATGQVGSYFTNLIINPRTSDVGTGLIIINDPNFPVSAVNQYFPDRTDTFINVNVKPGSLHHFMISARTSGGPLNSVDATLPYDLFIEAYDENNNFISTYNGTITNVKFTFDSSLVTASPKLTNPIFPTNRSVLQFSSGKIKIPNLRLPKSGQTLQKLKVTSNLGLYSSNEINISSFAGAISSLKLLSYDPLQTAGVVPSGAIDYSLTDVVTDADQVLAMYVVAFDTEVNPTTSGVTNLATSLATSGAIFGFDHLTYPITGNALRVDLLTAKTTPYTGKVTYIKSPNIVVAEATVKSITVNPGAQYRYDLAFRLPHSQGGSGSSSSYMIAGELPPQANYKPFLNLCLKDMDGNIVTGFNGTKSLAFNWKNTSFQTLQPSRYEFPASGVKTFYKGCMIDQSPTDTDIEFMVYEAGLNTMLNVSDGSLSDGNARIAVYPNSPYLMSSSYAGTAVAGYEKTLTVEVLDKYSNRVTDSTIPITLSLTSSLINQEITGYSGLSSVSESNLSIGPPSVTQSFSGSLINGVGQITVYSTQSGSLTYNLSTTALRSAVDGGAKVATDANVVDYKPDVPVALRWNPALGPNDTYSTSAAGWASFIAELVDRFDNIVITNSNQAVSLTLEGAVTDTLRGTTTRSTSYGQVIFSGINYLTIEPITLRATHAATGFSVTKNINIIQGNPQRIILTRSNQTLNEGVLTLASAVSGSIGTPFTVNHDNSDNLTYTFKAYIVDDTFNRVPGWGGYVTPNPDDTDAVILDANDNVIPSGAPVSFSPTGEATFKVKFRTAGANQKVSVNCHGFVASSFCHATDLFTVNPGPVNYFVPVLQGQALSDPGKTTLSGAVPAAVTNQTASVAQTVKVYATDVFFNTVTTSAGNFSGLQLSLTNDSYASNGGSFNLTNGYGSVNVINYYASSNKTLAVSTIPPSGSALTSATYTVNPGPASKVIALHASQVHVPGAATYAEAVTGSSPSLNACADQLITFKAVDNRYNTVTSDTSGISFTTLDATDVETSYLGSFTSGVKTFTYKPVRVGTDYTVTPSSGANYSVETPAKYNVINGTSKKLLVLLNGQVFTGGFLNQTDAVTGSILVTPTAGVSHSARVMATDTCHNQLYSSLDNVTLMTSDANDAEPPAKSLIGGQVDFNITNTTAGNAHTATATTSGFTTGVTRSYSVVPNIATKIIAMMPGQTDIPGKTTEAQAVSGSITTRTVNVDYTATVKLTDNWHNTITDSAYNSVSIYAVTSDVNDTQTSAVNLSSGVATMTFNQKTAGSSQTINFTSSGSIVDTFVSSGFTVSPSTVIKAITLLPGQTLNPGKGLETDAITGTIANPLSTAGANFAVRMYAVDSFHNIVTTYAGAISSLSTSDPNDTNPTSPSAFTAGVANFTVLNTTRANGHTVTPVTTLATNRASDPYNITQGVASQAIALLPNQILTQGAQTLTLARSNNTSNSYSVNYGTSFNVKIYITDAYYNIIQNDTRSVTLTAQQDAYAVISGGSTQSLAGASGEFSFDVTNYKAGTNLYLDFSTSPNLTTKTGTPNYTVNSGAATNLIAIFPGQTHNPGASTMAAALTGSATTCVACVDTYQVTFKAVDDRYNTVATYTGSMGIDTTEAGNPKTSFTSQTFSAGVKSISILPTKVGTFNLSISDRGGLNAPVSTFAYTVNAGALKYVVPLLTGETLNQGTRTISRSGSIINPVAGSAYTVNAYSTDQCFNAISSVASVTLVSADPYDTNPVAAALVAGTKAFTLTHTTATTSFPQSSVTQHVITPTIVGGTGVNSSNYIVDTGARTKHLVLMPGETFATPGKGTARTNIVTGTPTAQVKGVVITANVYATDNFYNKIISETSSVTLTSNDAAAVITPSGASTFTSGAKAFTVTHNALYPASSAILTSNDGTTNFTSAGYTVKDTPPTTLTYSPTDLTMTKGSAYTFTPSNLGGAVVSYAVTAGTLPAGLTINTATGVISGTPTTLATSVAVTITATNTGGTTTKALTFVVKDVPPSSLSYSGGPSFTWEATQASVSTTPTSSGGAVVSYALTAGTFPTGVTLNATSGIISGTPTATGTFTPTITATNTGGTTTASLSISVKIQRPTGFNYTGNPFTYVVNTTVVSITPTTFTGGAIASYSIATGTLPTGLSLNSTNGAITGTPTVVGPQTFTVRGTNISGFFDRSVTMTVNDKAPVTLTYSGGTPQTWTKLNAYSITPSVGAAGGAPTSYSVTTTGFTRLPSGVTLNTSTGVISGNPSELGTFTPTITANNATGSTTLLLTLIIVDIPPSALAYSDEAATYTLATAITNNTPTSSGGAVVSYSISPSLPQGLALSTTTGIISGTPRMGIDTKTFTITATNTGGSTTKNITLTVELPQKNMILGWWRAEDTSSGGTGSSVNTWTDKVNALSFTQNTSMPTYNYTSSKHMVTFATQSMGISNDILDGDGNKTIIVAYKTTTFSATNTILSFGNDLSNLDGTARSIALATNGSVITQDQTVALTPPLAAEGVVSLVFASGSGQKLSNMLFYHQGASKTHNGSSGIGINFGSETGALDFSALGARLDSNGSTLINKFTGSLYEVVVFNTNLSATERSAVECHLYYKYGLTAMGCAP